MKRVVGCLLILLLAAPAFAAYNVARLEEIATRDIIPEIQMAAGLALVDYYAATKGETELIDLATNGATKAIRTAAGMALSRVWIGIEKTYDELLRVAAYGETPELRMAAVDPLLDYLITKDESMLEVLYRFGGSEAVRYAAAKAYFHLNRGQFEREDLEAICQDGHYTDGYRKAAAELLAGHYLFPPATALTREELEEKALTADSSDLRYAAAVALSSLLIQSDMTEEELIKKVASFYLNESFTAEYKLAYERALANRWAAGL